MAGELILIAEDNDKNRKLARDVLTFKGYTTIEAEAGDRADPTTRVNDFGAAVAQLLERRTG